MFTALVLTTSALVGAILGRWWAVLLAIPAGLLASRTFSLEDFSDAEVGVLFGAMIAIGLTAGVVLRKVVNVRPPN